MAQIELHEMISKTQAAKAIGKSPRTLDRMIQEGSFPAGIVSRGRAVWLKSEVAEWQQERIAERDARIAEQRAEAAETEKEAA